MKKVIFLISVFILPITTSLTADTGKDDGCEKALNHIADKAAAIEYLTHQEFAFTESFETMSVRGIQHATFFSCDKKTGYLLVETHEEAEVYKNVPMDTWQEFSFANSVESYYKYHIKYKYVPV